MGKEPTIEIERQDPGKMSTESCQHEDHWQRIQEREEDNVVDHDPSSLEPLHLPDHAGNPVFRILLKQFIDATKVFIRSVGGGRAATLQGRCNQGEGCSYQKCNAHPH